MAALSFAGYAALFDVRDSGGDTMRRGAFAGAAVPLPLLWQHDPARRIGRIERLREDGIGLFVEGVVGAAPGCAAAVAAMLREGAVNGLSFGYRVLSGTDSAAGRDGRAGRDISAVDLLEVSIVTNPMQAGARVLAGSLR